MGRRADVTFAQTAGVLQFNGAGTDYLIQTPTGVLYFVYVDTGSDVAFKKSTDGGLSWSAPTIVFAGTVTNLSVWYDRWSDIAAGLIHCAYTESAADDTLYRTINTESSDALSTQTTIFAGASTAAGGHLSITRAKGGNVYCKTVIDAGAEGGFYRLPNANVPSGAWDAARTVDETIANGDMMILLPDLTAADTQDIIGIFWDASANEISRKLYDDSGNSWSETSISTGMTEQAAATAFPHFDAAVDLTNDRIILVAWSAIDTANADLRCWIITNSSITEVTEVVLNSTDDQGLASVSIDAVTGDWTVFYAGASDGSETFLTSVNIYCKGSRDDGTTWGPETKVTTMAADITYLVSCPWMYVGGENPPVGYHTDIALDGLIINVDRTVPVAQLALGV
jgi:hypothetical protein